MIPPLCNKKHPGAIKPVVLVDWYQFSSRNIQEVMKIKLLLTILDYHYTTNNLAKSSGSICSNKTLIYTLFLTQMPPPCTIKPVYNKLQAKKHRLGVEGPCLLATNDYW
jgi:hypothetical protein